MNKTTIIGIACWLGAALLLGFQAISGLMKTEGNEWETLSLVDIFGENAFSWILDVPWAMAESGLTYVSTMPAYIFLLCVGLVFFIISAFLKV